MKPMIDINELRLGNYLMYDGWHPDNMVKKIEQKPYPTKIVSIELDEKLNKYILEGDDGFSRAYTHNFKPITITQEIVDNIYEATKSSINKNKYLISLIPYTPIHYINLYFEPTCGWRVSLETSESEIAVEKIKYVHQLQNWYHLLCCGQELTIKI